MFQLLVHYLICLAVGIGVGHFVLPPFPFVWIVGAIVLIIILAEIIGWMGFGDEHWYAYRASMHLTHTGRVVMFCLAISIGNGSLKVTMLHLLGS